ncbi:Panacea domain-containing protein [Runella sp.]|uniref:Panacea domain-containing protein n=1 Tax=Runella sp. TaxID=1960881 RepID=UPI003D0EF0E0
MQKLVYYAQGWSLAIFNRSLFEQDFQSGSQGPTLPELFESYEIDLSPISKEVEELLMDVRNMYYRDALEEWALSDGPWQKARGELPLETDSNNIITKESMHQYYTNKLRSILRQTK